MCQQGFISECHRVLLLSWLTSSNKIQCNIKVEINAITQVKGAEGQEEPVSGGGHPERRPNEASLADIWWKSSEAVERPAKA